MLPEVPWTNVGDFLVVQTVMNLPGMQETPA